MRDSDLAYRSAGRHRVDDVPEHWEVRRLRTVAEMRVSNVDKHTKGGELPVRLCNYVDVYKNDHITPKIPFMRATASAEEIERFRLKRGDVLITKDSETWDDIGVPALVTDPTDDLICGYHLAMLRPQEEILGPYLAWVLHAKAVACQFHMEAKGVTRFGLTQSGIQSVRIPLPPLHEQNSIVRFLDRADEEERQAIIHQAVTRGLNPNVRLKPSDVEWLGDMPEHWEARRLRTVVELRVSNVDKHSKELEIAVRLCNYVDVYRNEKTSSSMSFMTATASTREIERFRLLPGDVLITKDSENWNDIGVPAIVNESADDLISGYHLALLRPGPDVHGPYLARVLQDGTVACQFHVEAKGVTRFGLSQNAIQSVVIPLPPIQEQRTLADQLDQATSKIDSAVDRARHQTELIEEYRTRLIADVVTGKIDVREAKS